MLDAFERRRQVPKTFRGRIALDRSDQAGFANYVNLASDGYKIRVFLDEVEQTFGFFLAADPNEGLIKRQRTVKGQPLYLAGIAQIETVKGHVCIKLER